MEYPDEYFGYSRKEMLAFIPDGVAKVLEIGCGNGAFSRLLVGNGIECWGVEPERAAHNHASQVLSKAVYGTFHDVYADLPKAYFDAIVFNDVLEHMADPWHAMELANGLLSQNGSVVASIPNILYFPEFSRFLLKKDFRYTSGGTFDKTHLRFFTKKSIVEFLDDCGFVVEKMAGIHPYVSRTFSLFNICTFGYFNEMKYMQFGVRAKRKAHGRISNHR